MVLLMKVAFCIQDLLASHSVALKYFQLYATNGLVVQRICANGIRQEAI